MAYGIQFTVIEFMPQIIFPAIPILLLNGPLLVSTAPFPLSSFHALPSFLPLFLTNSFCPPPKKNC